MMLEPRTKRSQFPGMQSSFALPLSKLERLVESAPTRSALSTPGPSRILSRSFNAGWRLLSQVVLLLVISSLLGTDG